MVQQLVVSEAVDYHPCFQWGIKFTTNKPRIAAYADIILGIIEAVCLMATIGVLVEGHHTGVAFFVFVQCIWLVVELCLASGMFTATEFNMPVSLSIPKAKSYRLGNIIMAVINLISGSWNLHVGNLLGLMSLFSMILRLVFVKIVHEFILHLETAVVVVPPEEHKIEEHVDINVSMV